jgi:hypothetical protein
MALRVSSILRTSYNSTACLRRSTIRCNSRVQRSIPSWGQLSGPAAPIWILTCCTLASKACRSLHSQLMPIDRPDLKSFAFDLERARPSKSGQGPVLALSEPRESQFRHRCTGTCTTVVDPQCHARPCAGPAGATRPGSPGDPASTLSKCQRLRTVVPRRAAYRI